MIKEIECKTHPDAPHGFLRNASHTEDRYVCECEYWEEPEVNKRIRSLAEQAKQSALDAMIKITDKEQALKVYSETYDEKFAQLIVAECVEQVITGPNGPAPYAVEAALRLKKHFGVEE